MIETDRLLLFAEDRINLRKAYKEPIEKHQKLALTLKSTGSLGVTDQERYITVLNDVIVGEQEVIQDLKKIKVKNPKVQESHENFISQLENTVAYIIQIRGIYQSNNVTALLLAESQHVQNKADLIKEANRIGDEIDLEAEDHKDKLETLSQQINSEHARLKGQYNF